MSGTSADGIDAAVVETDGAGHVRPIAFHSLGYTPDQHQRIREAMRRALDLPAPAADPHIDAVAEELTLLHADAVQAALAAAGLRPADAQVVGFHGQTVAHRPERGWTWQIGDGDLLARLTGIDVVADFRSHDVAGGGQGAPLAPVFHRALAAAARLDPPVAFLNLGGVGNVTWIGPTADDILAFDTGPANALIDDWMRTHAGLPHDVGGQTAAMGRVDDRVLTDLLANPWLDAAPPKSLDRQSFSAAPVGGLNLADGAATLTAFTAASVARALAHLPVPPSHWLVCGGGRHNATLMRMLAERLGDVRAIEAIGWDGDAIEAQAFAYMAARHLRGLPISFPGTTGIDRPRTGGRLFRPD